VLCWVSSVRDAFDALEAAPAGGPARPSVNEVLEAEP